MNEPGAFRQLMERYVHDDPCTVLEALIRTGPAPA
jgi:hypothetical protein